MAFPRGLIETIIPLTHGRGFKKILRFNYRVGPKLHFPLVVTPQILSMGEPFFTRQALYFLSDVDCAVRTYSEEAGGGATSPEAGGDSEIRRIADDCLFEYSLRNPDSRLTTRSELPPRRTRRESTRVTLRRPGLPVASYMAVDGERVLLSTGAERSFEDLYHDFVGDFYDTDLGWRPIGEGAEAFPLGLCSADQEAAPVVFQELPYTYEEIDLLGRILPIDPEMIGRFSVSDFLKPETDESSQEAIVTLLNQPYMEQYERLPPAKHLEQETINVGRTCDPRLLDFYFAGLRSLSPVVEYKNYYNIIEYYFEDASLVRIKAELDDILDKLREAEDIEVFTNLAKRLQPGAEQDQIRQVVQRHTSLDRLRSFFSTEIPGPSLSHFENFNGVINGKEVQKIRIGNPDLQRLVADRIYAFRNAIFHSKRTFKGKETVVIRPCSQEEVEIVAHEVRLIKMIAQEIIKQTRT